MNTLQTIATGALLTGSTVFGLEANAQNVFTPTQIKTETSIISNNDVTGIPMHRTEIGNDFWTLRYDYDSKLNNSEKPANVGLFSLNKLYNKNGLKFGVELYQVGNFDGKDKWFLDASATKKFKENSINLFYGKGKPYDGPFEDYGGVIFNNPKLSAGATFYAYGPVFDKKTHTDYFGRVIYRGDHTYASFGNKVQNTFGSFGIHGFENYGEYIFGIQDRVTGNIWIRSQMGFGKVNKDFYNTNTFDVSTNYFTLPEFFQKYFTIPCSKASLVSYFDIKTKPMDNIVETEFGFGTDRTPIPVNIGVNTEYCGGKSKSGFTVGVSKELKFKKFNVVAEAQYNSRIKSAKAYVKAQYRF